MVSLWVFPSSAWDPSWGWALKPRAKHASVGASLLTLDLVQPSLGRCKSADTWESDLQ